MNRLYNSLVLISTMALFLCGCGKDPQIPTINKPNPSFFTGQTALAIFRMIDSGVMLLSSGGWPQQSGALPIDMDGDSTADIQLEASASKSAGSYSFNCQLVSTNSSFSFYQFKELLYRHFRTDTSYQGTGNNRDTILQQLDYYDKDSNNQMGTQMGVRLPILPIGIRIDTLPDAWVSGVGLKVVWQTPGGVTHNSNRPHLIWYTNPSYIHELDWQNATRTYICVRKAVQSRYKFGWVLLDKDLKIISAAMQK